MNNEDWEQRNSNNKLISASGTPSEHKNSGPPVLSPIYLLIIIILGIILAEIIAMIAISYVKDWPYNFDIFLDELIMMLIIGPLLYIFSFRPLVLQIKQRNQANTILQARLHMIQFANNHSLVELLQKLLDEFEMLTGSTLGFFHIINDDQLTLEAQAFSNRTLNQQCKIEAERFHSDIAQGGVWTEAVRLRGPVIHNNYAALTNRKGLPDGHPILDRELVVPILRANQVVAVIGLGNKPQDYTAGDVELVTTFADFAWDIVEHKESENVIRQSEEKFRSLANWTYDWEKWLDPQGNFVYNSPSCERITGYTPEEFMRDPDLLARIVHPDDRQRYLDHSEVIHYSSTGPLTIEYRIIARDGSEHWIEHICRPLVGPDNRFLGRRISNRDISERKQANQKIIQQAQNEAVLIQTIRTIQTDIARDLHDTLGQNISFLRMQLDDMSETLDCEPERIAIQIQNMTLVANESYDLVRSMLAVLQTDYSADPLSLFTRYADRVAERASFRVSVTSQGDPFQLSQNQIRQLFYIFREALNNIEKYAMAKEVSGMLIWEDHTLTLTIRDNGRGFDLEAARHAGHYGIKFMRERADLLKAAFSIQSTPSEGTTISVVVPNQIPVDIQ